MPGDDDAARHVLRRSAAVRLLAMDVDGTLTDGGVYVLEDGQEFRRFDIKDGLGLRRVLAAGLQVVWISSGACEAALHRARRLGIFDVYYGIEDKAAFLEQVCFNKNMDIACVAYMGDDLTDLDVMQRAGVSFAPCDAVDEVKAAAAYVTRAPGGHGAVREMCDFILRNQSMSEAHD